MQSDTIGKLLSDASPGRPLRWRRIMRHVRLPKTDENKSDMKTRLNVRPSPRPLLRATLAGLFAATLAAFASPGTLAANAAKPAPATLRV